MAKKRKKTSETPKRPAAKKAAKKSSRKGKAIKQKKTPKNRSRSKKLSPETLFNFLQLRHIRLVQTSADLHIADNELPKQSNVAIKAEVALTSDNLILVTVLLEVSSGDDTRSSRSRLSIMAQYQAVFSVEGKDANQVFELSDDIAKIGITMTWPYLREFVQSTTIRMGLPPVILTAYSPAGEAENAVSVNKTKQ